MDILKWFAINFGAKHLLLSTVVVSILAGVIWVVVVKAVASSKAETVSGSVVTNTTTGQGSPIVVDNHGQITNKTEQNSDGSKEQKAPSTK